MFHIGLPCRENQATKRPPMREALETLWSLVPIWQVLQELPARLPELQELQ